MIKSIRNSRKSLKPKKSKKSLKPKKSIRKSIKYNKPRSGMKSRWSIKYKKSIDCKNPKGFSQKQYCKRKSREYKYINK